MQAPTHLVTGILIQKAVREIGHHPLQYFLVASLAIMSHGILDKLARFTYHPPDPLTNDWFWISYHLFITFLTIFIIVKYWRKYKLGIFFSVLPDFDWVVIHSSNLLSFSVPFWKDEILHKFFFSFLDFLPFFSLLNTLPDLSLKRIGVLPEIGLFTILLFVSYTRDKKQNNKKQGKMKTWKNENGKCNDEGAISTSDWVDKLQIYQTAMDHEQNIRMTYQGVLATLEVGLFVLFFTLYQLGFTQLWILCAIGIILCFLFGVPSEFRASNVDLWRWHIVKLVKQTDVWDAFKDSKYRWIPSLPTSRVGFWAEYLFGHWFERILITIMLIGWDFLMWYFPSPSILRVCGILAVIGWIIYAFLV